MASIGSNKPVRSTFDLLRITFGIVPIVAGADKFKDVLTHWENYLNPSVAGMLPFTPHAFMMIVGVIEILAGITVLIKPAIGGLIVAAWLTLIALTWLAGGNYLDVAVRRPRYGHQRVFIGKDFAVIFLSNE